jgi:hypothetical protein
MVTLSIIFVTADSEAVLDPVVMIQLDSEEQNVSVAPGDDHSVVFTGKVTVSAEALDRVQTITVFLRYYGHPSGRFPLEWTGTEQAIFTAGITEIPFSCSASAYEGAWSDDLGMLIVEGHWMCDPGYDSGEATSYMAIVNYLSFSRPRLDCLNNVTSADVDEVSQFRLYIRNNGNSYDEISIQVHGDDVELENEIPKTLKLNRGDEYPLDLFLKGKSKGSKEIVISVKGANGGSFESDEITLHLEVSDPSKDGADRTLLLGIGIVIVSIIVLIAIVYAARRDSS